jgi:uncharacterized protein YcbK (DUF882 family)
MKPEFLRLLDHARGLSGVPFKINSGFRCPKHNAELPDASVDSSHLKGLAADIECRDDSKRIKIVNALIIVGFVRIGLKRTFIHTDLDYSKNQALWLYNQQRNL